MSRSHLIGIEFVVDGELAVVEFLARQDTVCAVDLEQRDRDHPGAVELEGVRASEKWCDI